MILMLIMLVIYVLLMLQSIAFYTLLERHMLGLTQHRFGPKKTSWYGILQPILDGLKLCKKEQIIIFNCTPSMFLGVTLFNFVLFYMEFMALPYWYSFITIYWSFLLIMVLLAVNVYFLIMGGIFSKSKYSYLGGMRSSVASVSYEIMFSINMLIFMMYNKSYTLVSFMNIGVMMLFFSFFISVLVELGRTPFDYSESESELVSGFNTEYSSVGFVLLFLKEYGSLLFFSVMTSVLFFSNNFFMTVLIFSLFIIVRSSYPRFRYDHMMNLMWLQLFFNLAGILWCTYFMLL